MGRPTPHRKQSNTRPEPQRHNSGNTASFAAGIIAGAVAAHMSHRYKGNDDDEEIEYDLRGQKQVTFEDDYRRQPYNSYGSGTNLKSCFRKPNNYEQDSAPPPYEACTTKSTSPTTKAGTMQASPPPAWIWSDKKQMYYYDSSDGQVRTYDDNTREALAPPPRPEAPQWIWDKSRNMWYRRDDVGKCWVYYDGPSIPYPKDL